MKKSFILLTLILSQSLIFAQDDACGISGGENTCADETSCEIGEGEVVPYIPFSTTGNTTGLAKDFTNADDFFNSTGGDYVYEINLTEYSVLNISTCGAGDLGFDPVITFYQFDDDCNAQLIAGNDDYSGLGFDYAGGGGLTDEEFGCTASNYSFDSALFGLGLDAGDYMLVVSGYSSEEGAFPLTIEYADEGRIASTFPSYDEFIEYMGRKAYENNDELTFDFPEDISFDVTSSNQRDECNFVIGPDAGCDGVCFSGVELDCAGACGGSAEEDCAGACGGSASNDECGVCNGDNSSCADCAGVPNGTSALDDCGVCDGPGTSTYYMDADGDGLGQAGSNVDPDDYDNCFEYEGMELCCNSTYSAGWCSWSCDAGLSEAFGGNCYGHGLDGCCYSCTDMSACVEVEDTSVQACSQPDGYTDNVDDADDSCFSNDYDCSGECTDTGSAYVDDCGVCDGENASMDDCGVCDGGNADDLGCGCFEPAPSGCDNTCGSALELDECGECGGSGPDQHFTCSGFKPETKAALQEAVDMWVSSPESTEATYGHISDWDVSLITDMSWLFNGKITFNENLSNWDVSNVTSMAVMFKGCDAFEGNGLENWDVSNVINMSYIFSSADIFNGDISAWDVSNVTNMQEMFQSCDIFNHDLSDWDVSNVTTMRSMFRYSPAFNGDISGWDVSSVTDIMWMFYSAGSFNQDISGWDVSSVTNMRITFSEAGSFNQDLSGWDVSNVTDMDWMFTNADNFNADISTWDVSNVTSMREMFAQNDAFNQDISNWDVSSVTSMNHMFFSSSAFNQDISNWDVSNVTIMDNMFLNTPLSDENQCAIQSSFSSNENWPYDWTENQGCDGVCFSGLVDDECGVCDGDNSSCADCAGVPNGLSELDACGVCDGANVCAENACVSDDTKECHMVDGECWCASTTTPTQSGVEMCGYVDATEAGEYYSASSNGGAIAEAFGKTHCNECDCATNYISVSSGFEQISSSSVSACWNDVDRWNRAEDIYGPTVVRCANLEPTRDCDFVEGPDAGCDGVCFSGLVNDDCGVCVGGNADMDCAGVCFGDSALDDCGVCDGGNANMDECGVCDGNSSSYAYFDILNVVTLVDAILEDAWSSDNLYCTDVNDDGMLDIVDIVMMVEVILGSARMVDASEITLIKDNNALAFNADGFVGGIQLTLSHGDNFALELTASSMVSDYRTNGNSTTVIIAAPESGPLFTASSSFNVENVTAATSAGEIQVTMPMDFGLSTAYPNPFNPSTSFDLNMSSTEMVSVDVYNVMGQLVSTIHSGELAAGVHSFTWNGAEIASGAYFIKATTATSVATQKVMLMK